MRKKVEQLQEELKSLDKNLDETTRMITDQIKVLEKNYEELNAQMSNSELQYEQSLQGEKDLFQTQRSSMLENAQAGLEQYQVKLQNSCRDEVLAKMKRESAMAKLDAAIVSITAQAKQEIQKLNGISNDYRQKWSAIESTFAAQLKKNYQRQLAIIPALYQLHKERSGAELETLKLKKKITSVRSSEG